MRTNNLKATIKAAVRVVGILSFAAFAAFGATSVINLTAGPATATLPDGTAVPMWGYTCGTPAPTNGAQCVASNGTATAGVWSPVMITVPFGNDLNIVLTNNLFFTPTGGTTNYIPTSLTIVGQLGGGLGNPPQTVASPTHTGPTVTWSTVGAPGSPTFQPPSQGPRVQSFGTEVAAAGNPSPLSKEVASGATLVWTAPRAGTYLLESGTHPSIQGPMGLYGMVIVNTPGTNNNGTETSPGTPYPGVTYDAGVGLLFSEIDPVQNNAVNAAVNTNHFSETAVWSGQPGGCGNPSSSNYQTCYPPAVNYTPLYFLINGVAFDKSTSATAGASLFKAFPTTLAPASGPGNVLVRMVNAGLRMHVPSIVGATTIPVTSPTPTTTPVPGFSLVAEDGNPLPGNQRVQSEVFMAAGKTYDVMMSGATFTFAVFDRALSLSGNMYTRDAGMLGYISVNNAALPAKAVEAPIANADLYPNVIPGKTLTVSDATKGVIANDINVYGVALVSGGTHQGVLTLNPNGTFTYVANAGFTGTDVFTYQANGSSGPTTTITFSAAASGASSITVADSTFTSAVAGYISITTPGVLAVDSDSLGYPLMVNVGSVSPVATSTCAANLVVYMSANGGFNANLPTANTVAEQCEFTYTASNSFGATSGLAHVYINFPAPSNLTVNVVDGYDKTTAILDYKWIIEEDKTFYVDPTCRTNPPDSHCPLSGPIGPSGTNVVGTFGVNFHTSDDPFVAQGCTGPKSCEAGQTVYDNGTPCTGGPGVPAGCSTTAGQHVPAVCDVGNGVCRPDTLLQGRTAVWPRQVALDPHKRYYVSVLPGDAADPFGATGTCSPAQQALGATCVGHGMGGAPVTFAYNGTAYVQATTVTVLSQPAPYPPGKLSVMVFEDDFPLNGEQDAGGGVDVLAPNEPGLGSFQIHLWDAFGGNGDFTGQMTYDMFNQPLTNSLNGYIDPATHQNACPISPSGTNTFNGATGTGGVSASGTSTPNVISVSGVTVDPSQIGTTLTITGGSGFTKGTYTISAVTPGTPGTPGQWTLSPEIPGAVAATATASGMQGTQSAPGITGMIVTCPTYEADGQTLSPLAGQAVIANLMPGRWGVIATPAADRIAKGEEWLQTNTLDGQKAHDSFTRIGEPIYFQEFGPASYHVVIGFANPAIINQRLASVCSGLDAYLPGQGNCTNTIKGTVVGERLSRTPDERLYGTDTRDAFSWSRCFVSIGDPDGEDFAFAKCNADGTFTLTGIPTGDWRVTTFDQWNDQLVDGLSTPVAATGNTTVDMGGIAATQWQTNLDTKTFIDDNHNGVYDSTEAGIPFNSVTVRLRDGSLENNLLTDFTGTANFNETFPLFSWYVVETDVTRYKNSGTHVVYDVGGPADGSKACGVAGYPPCGPTPNTISSHLANTAELVSVPTNLRVPGAVYCANADCNGYSIQGGPGTSASPSSCTMASSGSAATGVITCSNILSSGRIDPPWVEVEGWQGFPGQFNFMEFGKIPYAANENGGIQGHVVYASTRPFDDPQMLVQTQWEPLVPHVLINLYQENTAPDGSTSLKLIDHTTTSSFDDWAQGYRALDGMPNMNCPGQWTSDLFYFTLYNQPNYLNTYTAQHPGNNVYTPTAFGAALPDNSQFKCYDGMHNWNQIQPVPYDGMYKFPSVTAVDANGRPTATNCDPTVCIADPAALTDPNYDAYYAGLPMLPKGKYVVEVVLPPGYELVKEEDKNILIGDNYIAPVTQEFGGLGNVYIIPDQAAIGATYNANNAQNPTQDLGATPRTEAVPVFPFEPVWPCVGQLRVVPDYMSLYPASKQVSPFAGSYRRLCDRKEVTLSDQMGAIAKFYIYTSTHKAAKFTGGITDDFTSEFDPFSPQFGEKFSPPNLPVAIRDWTGAETNRVYADEWGSYNGMTYSTWEVNPPNPTGYAPTVMVMCMNDRGNGSTPDPLFQSNYSQFCYELPFMPGTTEYLDTPVVPTAAFAEGYNRPDCAEPANTPAISRVDGNGTQGGPWVTAPGQNITITALGNQTVNNYGYSGPAAHGVPFNQQTISRPYGFGAQCTTTGTGCPVVSSVTIGGKTASIVSWSNTSIVATVPTGVPACPVQQQSIYGGSNAQCGQLVITNGTNGLQSIDAVTVTIGGKPPTYVSPTTPLSPTGVGSLQQAMDAAKPGDLLILLPGVYSEMAIMWKPLRLQGVGAASVVIDANTQPAGKLDPWRAYIECMFGLSTNGQANTGAAGAAGNNPTTTNTNPFDPTKAFICGTTPSGTAWYGFVGKFNQPQVDRLPLEGILGWDTTVNGNLAQLLQEPTLMGAYEGAGITVLSKGVNVPSNTSSSYYGNGTEAAFPTGTLVLGTGDCSGTYPSNFQCNPSSIDGISITDASQGGGGIFVHAWAHNLQIANNRIYDNIGTLSGGINVGQGESPDIYSAGTTADSDPGSCRNVGTDPVGLELPYCFDLNVNVHNNWVSSNTSIGDELFSGTPAGTGGVAFCTGADYYKFNYNWLCGNMSTGDGGGLGHIGYIWNGDVEHNTIIFNQSLNPTIQTNGGGLIVMGAAPDGFAASGVECGSTVSDADCAPGLPDGTGPGLVINANLFMGNAAESGSGGGIRLQSVNGTEINSFTGSNNGSHTHSVDGVAVPNWNTVTITNNIITDNMAGWDGAGVSLQDALAVNIINNTIASNDSSATAGPLFNTLGSPFASAPNAGYQCLAGCTSSAPQPAGLVAMVNSPNMITNLTAAAAAGTVTCPTNNPNCLSFSNPYMANDVFWQNRSFFIGVGSLNAQFQQNILALFVPTWSGTTITGTPAPNQPATDATTAHGTGATITGGTGACTTPAGYWDIGVRGDHGPGQHQSGFTLRPTYSLMTNTVENAGTHNTTTTDPNFMSQYCNGSRIPPEAATLNPNGAGFQVPPGISDATVPNPIFNLTPAATVDEGNNWVNLQWGPLSLTNPVTGNVLGNYALASSSGAIDQISTTAGTFNTTAFPTLKTDFFGNPRPDSGESLIDYGAIESLTAGGTAPVASVTGGPLSFGNVVVGTNSATQTLTLHNTGTASLTGITYTFSSPRYSISGGTCPGNGGTLTVATGTCTIQVRFSPTATGSVPATLTITDSNSVPVTNSPVTLTGTGIAATHTATVTGGPLAFGGQTVGTTSTARTVTVTNTGNSSLTGGTFTFGGGTPQPFSRTDGTCTGTLAVGANCTVNVVFSPTVTGAVSRTLTVAYTGGTVTGSPVTLTGTGQ